MGGRIKTMKVTIKDVQYQVEDGNIEWNKYGQWAIFACYNNEQLAQVRLEKLVLIDKLDKKLESIK